MTMAGSDDGAAVEPVPVDAVTGVDAGADTAAAADPDRADPVPAPDLGGGGDGGGGDRGGGDRGGDAVAGVDVLDVDVVARTPAGMDTGGIEDGDVPAPPAWRRTLDALRHPRLTGAGTVIAILVGLLGFALIAQVKSNSNESTLANDRPDDLVRILSDLDARKDRLSTEISALQDTVHQLASGAQGRQAALDEAAKRADELGILAGTLPAQGRGLSVTFQPQRAAITSDEVLNAVEELRGAGAEAMSISGTTGGAVRIVASTYFTDATGGIDVGGQVLVGALTIEVIGDPQTMQTALNIPGGVVETVHNAGGNVLVDQPGTVLVTAIHTQDTLRYAQPAS